MSITVRIAKSNAELNDILDFRYKVHIRNRPRFGDLGLVDKKLIDTLDIFPSTLNFLATHAGNPVATLRLSEFIPDNVIQNLIYSFAETHQNLKGSFCLLDMLTCQIEQTKFDPIFESLIKMAVKTAGVGGYGHVGFLAPAHLEAKLIPIGFTRIVAPFNSRHFGIDVVPLLLNTTEFLQKFGLAFKDRELLRFIEIFYYSIFEPGEILAVQGEKGITAYLLTQGKVDVLIKGPDATVVRIASLGEGSLIGEVAMLTSEVRTASLVATELVSTICFDREDFLKKMYEEPHRSLDIFKIFSKRLADSNRRLAELQKNA